jgi:DNA-binding MarR family transcriptional regulator
MTPAAARAVTQPNCTGKLKSLPDNAYIASVAATDPSLIASELRVVLGQLVRRLRAENRLPLMQGAVIARIEREGPMSVSDIAAAERVRPQSMAQTVGDLETRGLVSRRPDPGDGRRALVELNEAGLATLETDRRQREGWLARTIEQDLTAADQAALNQAVAILRRLAES